MFFSCYLPGVWSTKAMTTTIPGAISGNILTGGKAIGVVAAILTAGD